MTPKAINIAIAKACGWQIIHDSKRPVWGEAHHIPPGKTIGWFMSFGEPSIELPDYYSSLDDMHEAEKVLTDEQWDLYCGYLGGSLRSCANASAPQRAEAFLRTIGKWEET